MSKCEKVGQFENGSLDFDAENVPVCNRNDHPWRTTRDWL